MAQIRKVEGQIEIKCDADKFFDVWARKPHQISKICPHKYPKIEFHEGSSWHSIGAISTWNYVSPLGGKIEFAKTKLEEIDEEKRSVTYSILDGELMRKYYKTFKDKIEVIPKAKDEHGGTTTVKWSVMCEQKSEHAPDPKLYIDFLLSCAEAIDVHLSSA